MKKYFTLDFNASNIARVIFFTFVRNKIVVSLRSEEKVLVTKNLSGIKRDITEPNLPELNLSETNL
ncbi:MAG: hypothetical protein R8M11_06975 [Gallionella sp.]